MAGNYELMKVGIFELSLVYVFAVRNDEDSSVPVLLLNMADDGEFWLVE